MTGSYVEVQVVAGARFEEDCEMRFHAVGPPRAVQAIRHEFGPGDQAEVTVAGLDADGSPMPATAVPVDDSSAGMSVLVHGGEGGLRLTRNDTGAVSFEPYLLLHPDCLAP